MMRPSRARGDNRLTIIVTGYLVRRPVGGLAWHYGQYVVGLKRLGHEVVFLEDSEDFPSCWVPPSMRQEEAAGGSNSLAFTGLGRDPSYGLKFAGDFFDRLGSGGDWCYYDAHTDAWLGPSAPRAPKLLREADLLLNVSGSITLRPWHMEIPRRVLIDTDPVFSQARHRAVAGWLDRSLRHNVFLTFGENFGRPDCDIPDDGLPWRPTRQPIVTDLWQRSGEPDRGCFTTVMSWKSYDAGQVEGRAYGLKAESFQPFLSLPSRTQQRLEIALEGPDEAWALLSSAGWGLVDAGELTRTPWAYRDYVQRSRAEFAVAKEAYVSTRSGWFSERSAAYLASGRPVVCQDTGFDRWMEVGRGLLTFSNAEEALDGLASVDADYEKHARAARDLAQDHFDSSRVLEELIEMAYAGPIATPDPGMLPGGTLLGVFRELEREVASRVPEDRAVILLDENRLGVFGPLAGRRCLPFLERNGVYWGIPEDSETAIRELTRMRAEGCRHLVLMESARWWLEFFGGFAEFLEVTSEEIHLFHGFTMYYLSPSPAPPAANEP